MYYRGKEGTEIFRITSRRYHIKGKWHARICTGKKVADVAINIVSVRSIFLQDADSPSCALEWNCLEENSDQVTLFYKHIHMVNATFIYFQSMSLSMAPESGLPIK